jgi:hypothetical protein
MLERERVEEQNVNATLASWPVHCSALCPSSFFCLLKGKLLHK